MTLTCTPVAVSADHWPQFRGVNADGVAASDFPQTWDASTNVKWKIPVAGEGWSGPVVWEDRVFLTAAVNVDAATTSSESRPQPYTGGGGTRRSDLLQTTYRWNVLCLDADTGTQLWEKTARTGQPRIPRHSSNSFATETPVTDGEFVYAWFGPAGLYCFDMDGELQWERDLGAYEMRAGWGTSSSPVLFNSLLYLQVDNEQQSFLLAVDARSGDEVWRVSRSEPSQYSSPVIWRNSQRNELVTSGQVCRAYDPVTGKLLWQLDMSKGRSSATPLAVGDRLFVGTEHRDRGGSDDGGGFLFAVTPGGSGDITPKGSSGSSDHVLWQSPRSGIQMASPVICSGLVYLLERRNGIVHCIDAETGAKVARQRISGARAFWASPWTDGERVYCLDDGGTTYVLSAEDSVQVIGTNVIDEQAWSSPAIAGGALFLRTVDHLYCISENSGG